MPPEKPFPVLPHAGPVSPEPCPADRQRLGPKISPAWKSLLYRVEHGGAFQGPAFVLLACHALSRQRTSYQTCSTMSTGGENPEAEMQKDVNRDKAMSEAATSALLL